MWDGVGAPVERLLLLQLLLVSMLLLVCQRQSRAFHADYDATSASTMPCSGAAPEAPRAVCWRPAQAQWRAAVRPTRLEAAHRAVWQASMAHVISLHCSVLQPPAHARCCSSVAVTPPPQPSSTCRHGQDAAGQGCGHRVLHQLLVGQGARAHQHVCVRERAPDPRGKRARMLLLNDPCIAAILPPGFLPPCPCCGLATSTGAILAGSSCSRRLMFTHACPLPLSPHSVPNRCLLAPAAPAPVSFSLMSSTRWHPLAARAATAAASWIVSWRSCWRRSTACRCAG